MKVLLIARGYPQKHNKRMGLFEKEQAIALKKCGCDVAYAVVDLRSIRRRRKLGYHFFEDEHGIKVFEISWPIGAVSKLASDRILTKALFALYPHILEEFGRPDIVHAHFLSHAFFAADLCKEEKLPFVITEHSSYMLSDSLSDAVINKAKKAYGACNALIAVSSALMKNIEDKLGFSGYVIPNVVSLVSRTEEKPEAKPTEEEIRFVCAAYLLKGKGLDVLLKAFQPAVEKDKRLRLSIWGDGPEKKRLQKLCSELGLTEYVSFGGAYSTEDLDKVYGNGHAFVLASRKETFGVVYIEAMSYGLPVIATKCGGPEEFVNEDNGILVDTDNVEQLSEALVRMAEHIEDYHPGQIREYALNHYSPEVVGSQIIGVYRKVLENWVVRE